MSAMPKSGVTASDITYDYDYDAEQPVDVTIAWVSCKHISRATWLALMTSRPSEWGVFDAPFGINSISVIAFDYREGMPLDLI